MALRILKTNVDGLTSHVSHIVRVEENDGHGNTSFGPQEVIGIWPRALMATYHGEGPITEESMAAAHKRWLAVHHAIAIERKHHLERIAKVAQSLEGQLLNLESDNA
jgi:hypothetical protein